MKRKRRERVDWRSHLVPPRPQESRCVGRLYSPFLVVAFNNPGGNATGVVNFAGEVTGETAPVALFNVSSDARIDAATCNRAHRFAALRSGLLHLDVCDLHHLGPLLELGCNIIAELSDSEDHRDGAELGEPFPDRRVCQPCVNLAVEPRDDL